MEEISDRIQRKVKEDAMEIESRNFCNLIVHGVTVKEYDRFIKFIETQSPRRKGWEAMTMLLDTYENVKQVKQIVEYSEELKDKNSKLESRIAELENKEVKEKKKYIGGE
jgi:predicted RNase H-like nuclease (RuvC/YqgF family)